jgi:hypothetical protein
MSRKRQNFATGPPELGTTIFSILRAVMIWLFSISLALDHSLDGLSPERFSCAGHIAYRGKFCTVWTKWQRVYQVL